MSSYYDCSPKTNSTRVKVYGQKTNDIINNITGIFMLLTSIGVTFLIIFGFKTFIEPVGNNGSISPIKHHDIINLLFLLTFACACIIAGLSGMYNKIPNMSIYGFTSVIIIGVYTIFLFLSGKLNVFNFPNISFNSIKNSVLAVLGLVTGILVAYSLGYGNIKKGSKKPTRKERLRINREKKRIRNTASTIVSFSLLGAILLVTLVTFYMNKDN
jgi:uncharacterized BrkB/YihY/UPF0761 family membrane protein